MEAKTAVATFWATFWEIWLDFSLTYGPTADQEGIEHRDLVVQTSSWTISMNFGTANVTGYRILLKRHNRFGKYF